MVGAGGTGEGPGRVLERLGGAVKSMVGSWFVSQKFVFFLASLKPQDLRTLSDLILTRKLTPVVDKTFKLTEAAEAVRYLETGHARGKVVITMPPPH